MTRQNETRQNSKRRFPVTAAVALVIAIVALALRGCSDFTWNGQSPTSCPTATTVLKGDVGDPGLSAYDLWLALGNTGSRAEFLESLIGKPGPKGADGKVVYFGSNGQAGAAGVGGTNGKSAYQLWLESGNTGEVNDFLESLIGPAGAAGVAGVNGAEGAAGLNGLSAYELWVLQGNPGDETDFLKSLIGQSGADGSTGATGATGKSAYELWIASGKTGSETDFLNSLIGPAGTCTQGETGAQGDIGATGASAYEIWVTQGGHTGSELDFLASLIGDPGPQGDAGPVGPTGPKGDKGDTGLQGLPGASGMGYFGSFYDMTNQQLNQANPVPRAWTFSNATGSNNGVTIEGNGNGNSRIRFPATGWYNIAFSTVFKKTNSSAGDVDIWFAENGVNLADSNTRITIAGQAQTVAAWNFFYHCTDTSKYVEIMWWTADYSTLSVQMDPVATSPARPAVPSIILTVNQVN